MADDTHFARSPDRNLAHKEAAVLRAAVRAFDDKGFRAASLGEAADGTGADRLAALSREYALVMTQDFGICVTRTQDHELSDASRKRFRALKGDIDAAIRAVIAEGQADGSLAPGDPRVMAFALAGALNWIARRYRPDGRDSPGALAASLTETLMRGLLPRETR